MENKINIAEILKDCPKGTRLYSPMLGECTLDGVTPGVFPIDVQCSHGYYSFSEYGEYFDDCKEAECLLFPSKDCRTWEGFKKPNPKPEFKVGSVAISLLTGTIGAITGYLGNYVNITGLNKSSVKREFIRLAAGFEIDEWNGELHKVHKHYSRGKRRIIDWFLPFDRVLVRDDQNSRWRCGNFSHYNSENSEGYCFCCVGDLWRQCIPYNEKTAHLLGTTEEYKEE